MAFSECSSCQDFSSTQIPNLHLKETDGKVLQRIKNKKVIFLLIRTSHGEIFLLESKWKRKQRKEQLNLFCNSGLRVILDELQDVAHEEKTVCLKSFFPVYELT